MTASTCRPPTAPPRSRPQSRPLTRPLTRLAPVAWTLAAGGVLSQIAFPLTGGGTFALTVAAVVLLSAASLVHALATRGAGAAVTVLAVAGGGGLLVEAVGVATGVPFGGYDYSGTLGRELLGVPALVPLAWVMMAYPALAAARVLTPRRPAPATVAVGALALTSWDVFLDPQMVDAGHWTWDSPTPALPGVEGIPLSNFAGWLVVSLVMTAVLHLALPAGHTTGATRERVDALPLAVYLWTFWSSVMAHAVFFGRPTVALVGGLVMGLVGVPLSLHVAHRSDPAVRLLRRLRDRATP